MTKLTSPYGSTRKPLKVGDTSFSPESVRDFLAQKAQVEMEVNFVTMGGEDSRDKPSRLTEELRKLEVRRRDELEAAMAKFGGAIDSVGSRLAAEMASKQEARRASIADPSMYELPVIQDDPIALPRERFENQRAALDALSDEELAERTRRRPRRDVADADVPRSSARSSRYGIAYRQSTRQPRADRPYLRRLAVLEISMDLLATMFMAGYRSYEVVKDAVPSEAEVVGGEYDSLRDIFRLCLRHPSFAIVDEAQEIPVLPPPEIISQS